MKNKKEFEVMRTIGISNRSIMKRMVYESVFISMSGALTGLIIEYTCRHKVLGG